MQSRAETAAKSNPALPVSLRVQRVRVDSTASEGCAWQEQVEGYPWSGGPETNAR